MLVLASSPARAFLVVSPHFSSFFETSYSGLGLGMLVGFLVMCWAVGWRLIGYIYAGLCAFSLLLEKGGLMLALIATIFICRPGGAGAPAAAARGARRHDLPARALLVGLHQAARHPRGRLAEPVLNPAAA